MHTSINLTFTATTEPTLFSPGVLEQEKGLPGWAQDAPFKVAKLSNMPVCPHATHTHTHASERQQIPRPFPAAYPQSLVPCLFASGKRITVPAVEVKKGMAGDGAGIVTVNAAL